jgi:hypothetical protein
MSDNRECCGLKLSSSFLRFAAWYSLIVPFVAPALAYVILVASDGRLDLPLIAALCCAVSGFLLGAISIFGAETPVRGVLWKALIGIVASVVLGLGSCIYLSLLRGWNG